MGGLKRLFTSSKGLTAMSALAGVVLVKVLGVDPATADTVIPAILILAGLYIVGTSVEDHGAKRGGGK